tara:strand:+ start:340 stop:795 length:456 start_codon:yes stop_codon:yes gene_type:complete
MSLENLLGFKAQVAIDPETYKVKKKAISPFDFANSINYTKENLIVDDWSEKQYSAFIVNKAMSYSKDTVKLANEMNSRPHIDAKLQYDFLKGIVRKAKRYNKWLKPEKEERLQLIKDYFGYNNTKAQEAMRILTEDDLMRIEKLMSRGGKV